MTRLLAGLMASAKRRELRVGRMLQLELLECLEDIQPTVWYPDDGGEPCLGWQDAERHCELLAECLQLGDACDQLWIEVQCLSCW